MPSIYRLTPSLHMMNALRVDSNVSSRREEHSRDKEFFTKNPKRHTHIRRNGPGELDLALPVGRWLEAPALWLSVVRVSGDTHLAIPVYRGKQFWTEPKSDADAALILVEMSNRQGINMDEWVAFEDKVKAAETEVSAKNIKVH
jgi:hypothetical protein